ncbi:transcriptional regulator [Belliella sp. DSM 111904]|uniref:Transcriptional regulator n=1 Tax=Belliella filtrata TaxID=2923435 RepID=A0ABS9UX60_9BACT|nr:transcriptional regulator [Belliella filtrata]MCH7408761.1 transcriptional regulator [Belliella filtrata]
MKRKYDKAFENVIRLQVMSILMANERFDFNGFKEMMEVSDGNLSTHLRTLEKLEYIAVEKSFVGRKPQTNYWATTKGRLAFQEHLNYLENLIKEHKS